MSLQRPKSPAEKQVAEIERNEAEKRKLAEKERKESVRFWLMFSAAALAALASVAGVVLQLIPR